MKTILAFNIPYSTLSTPTCKFGKILVVDNFVEKNYIEIFRIRNYFKKDFLNFSFHYVRYCNHLVTFLEKNSHQFAFYQALNEVSQSIIFLVFFCTSDHLKSITFYHYKDLFLISKLNINWFLLFFIVFL